MERKNLALLCAGVLCFWLFALAFGSAQGAGLRAVKTEAPAQAAAADAPAAQTAAPADSLSLPCRAAVLIEPASGRVLYEKNADERVPIASITKLMTLLLTFEAVHGGKLTLDTPVPVSEHAYHMGGSQIWLEPGEQFTLDEMLRAICVSSANDAAVAVAELVGGSEPVFVEQMNARAAELGLQNTSFRNACGLDAEGHLSTARDVAALSCYILNTCPEILHYTGIWTDSLRNGQTQLVNTNKLLKRYSGITGLKTGTTGGAGVCISASATRDGLTLIAVILGAPSSAERFQAATALLDYGFAAYAAVPVPQLPDRPLHVFTNSQPICQELAKRDQITLTCSGGTLQRKYGCYVNPALISQLKSLEIDLFIFSCEGIDPQGALWDSNAFNADFKSILLKRAAQSLLLIDKSKFNRSGEARIGHLDDVTHIVSDAPQP